MKRLWARLREWWQARKRGERRIAPPGVRGRVYERKGGGGPLAVRGIPEASISARVFRAATGQWEDLGVISKPKKE